MLVLCALRPWPPPICAGAVVNAAFGSIAEAAATHRRPASHGSRGNPSVESFLHSHHVLRV